MNRIWVSGVGAVSPAGWGAGPLRVALERGKEIPTRPLNRPGWTRPLSVRSVPAPHTRAAFFSHPRLRRSSPITQYAVAAALEAVGEEAASLSSGETRVGVILCVMSGCVNYSRRFYDELLREPATASPLVFPETVFNAPASHLGALLGTSAPNYTLVGDPGTFLQGLALGAEWLEQGLVDSCLVIGAEEIDWLTADAFRLFTRQMVLSEGAGALYLRRGNVPPNGVELVAVTTPRVFTNEASALRAARLMAEQLRSGGPAELLCNSEQGVRRLDRREWEGWKDWPGSRLSPKRILGEGLMAAAAWQCVAAVDAIGHGRCQQALVSVVGCNQQAIGARFQRAEVSPGGH